MAFLKERRLALLNLGYGLFTVIKRGGDGDVATYQEAVILPPLAVRAHLIPPPPFLDMIEASLGRVTSWSEWPLNFLFAPPSPGSDFAVTTPRQGEVPMCYPSLDTSTLFSDL